MTNTQLRLILEGLLAELDAAIDKARDLVPDGAQRTKYTDILGREFEGDYPPIEVLSELHDRWQERFAGLEGEN